MPAHRAHGVKLPTAKPDSGKPSRRTPFLHCDKLPSTYPRPPVPDSKLALLSPPQDSTRQEVISSDPPLRSLSSTKDPSFSPPSRPRLPARPLLVAACSNNLSIHPRAIHSFGHSVIHSSIHSLLAASPPAFAFAFAPCLPFAARHCSRVAVCLAPFHSFETTSAPALFSSRVGKPVTTLIS